MGMKVMTIVLSSSVFPRCVRSKAEDQDRKLLLYMAQKMANSRRRAVAAA